MHEQETSTGEEPTTKSVKPTVLARVSLPFSMSSVYVFREALRTFRIQANMLGLPEIEVTPPPYSKEDSGHKMSDGKKKKEDKGKGKQTEGESSRGGQKCRRGVDDD